MAKTRFTEGDVKRAAKGALAAGLTVARLEIDCEGRVVVYTGAEADASPDTALKTWESKNAKR